MNRPGTHSGHWLLSWLLVLVVLALGSASPAADDNKSPPAIDHGFHHGQWPFAPPVRPAVPNVAREWVQNPIDSFIVERLNHEGLKPSHAADRPTLLRRVTYDLTGLPPTAAELAAFLADDSPNAYERVVDRLLASPRFGEHWAQHWLDLVRYADTEGFKNDSLRENAYRYRDYVIDSFNMDRPFDEFVRQQLAGDEIDPEDPDAVVATGYLRLYPDEDNGADIFDRHQAILDDVTDTTSLAFLGLTMGCAQCHNHKFDEILQTDYYRLQAFFASMAERDDVPIGRKIEVDHYRDGLAQWEQATGSIRAEIQSILQPQHDGRIKFKLGKYEQSIVDCYVTPTEKRTPYQEVIARMLAWRMDRKEDADPTGKLSAADQARLAALKAKLAEFDQLKPKPLPAAMSVEDVGAAAPPTHLLGGGSMKRPEAIVAPGFPEFLGADKPEACALSEVHRREPTTGRRTQLAHWLTRPDHPLTARVIVNRLWQHHFGRGLVATPNDFGAQGDRPTHPELLDWLATELVDHGWSLKHIHRLMVTSAAYRMSSLVDPTDTNAQHATQVDHDNKLLWHANRTRLDGEAIRDAMLQTTGELNLKMHGPSIRPSLPAGVNERYAWKPSREASERNRRSVYVLVKRNMRYPLFEAFDQPDLHQSCPRRAVTITAPQSLAMLNSELTLDLARSWAERLQHAHSDSKADLIRAAYRDAYGREATPVELKIAEKYLSDDSELAPTGIDAVTDFCHAIFNSNEFITVD